MPTVSYNGQSFMVDGRRIWILGAAMEYARICHEQWADRIADAQQAGFNTIVTGCPWIVHEPRPGRFYFDDHADVQHFIRLCADAGLFVILRVGPFIGSGYDGGGLPVWLTEIPDIALRQGNEPFLERVSRYFRRLCAELTDLQATKRGPLIAVQVEEAWRCGSDRQSELYLRGIARIVRENGLNVPLLNTNNLWADPAGTIDTWRGADNLLANLRQLRAIQPGAPRLITLADPASTPVWGASKTAHKPHRSMLGRLAEILAAGAQPIACPFHGGTNFGFLAGTMPGAAGTVATTAACNPPLGEAGTPGDDFGPLRRIITFANHFGHVFADLDPDYQPVATLPHPDDNAANTPGRSASTHQRNHGFSVCSLRGAGGQIILAFASGPDRKTSLLLDNGMVMPIDLGDQPVAWFLLNVDLHGKGRLNYTNVCPLAIVDRSIVVFLGPPRSTAFLSINGTPLQATVPTGAKPLLLQQKDLTLVIADQKSADTIWCADKAVYCGVAGLDRDGAPILPGGRSKAWIISADHPAEPMPLDTTAESRPATRRRTRSAKLTAWHAASAEDYVTGQSPRFASLAGPETLAACGAMTGYGWYRITPTITTTRKRLVHAPHAAGRIHFFTDGEPAWILGDGPGASPGPHELHLTKGSLTLTVLADNAGRLADGNDLDRPAGLFGHLYALKSLRAGKPRQVDAAPVDPLNVRPAVMGATRGHLTEPRQIEWTFTHNRKSPILVQITAATHGVLVLNDKPIAYYAGHSGAGRLSLMLQTAAVPAMKRGRNLLRFAPDADQPHALDDIAEHTTLYECSECLTDAAGWSFAKWEPPPPNAFTQVPENRAAELKTIPCWWRCSFTTPAFEPPLWLDTTGLSKGQAYLNRHNLGRYFTATRTGAAVGPQVRLYLPEPWLNNNQPNELLIFDEHGFSPHKTKLVSTPAGDLD